MAGAVVSALKSEAKAAEQKMKEAGARLKEAAGRQFDKKEFGEFLADAGLAALGTVIVGLVIAFAVTPFVENGQVAIGYLVGSLISLVALVGGYLLWKHYGDEVLAYLGLGFGLSAVLYFVTLLLKFLSLSLFV